MEKIVLYGAGRICKMALPHISCNYHVVGIIDSNPALQGKKIFNIPIISLDDYKNNYKDVEIIITVNNNNTISVTKILNENGINNYVPYYDVVKVYSCDVRPKLLSYSDPTQLEDLILYSVFCDMDDIFYIDVGSNDPIENSVTKLLYEKLNARGINIEPQKELVDITNIDRPRDINICCGLGNKEGFVDFYVQSGLSTVVESNIKDTFFEEKRTVELKTLKSICDDYLPYDQDISFLKIDVEGFEKEVLEGADFSKYRPIVIVMESTLPGSNVPCYDKWEYILLENDYHYVYSYGVNRYYVANEHQEYNDKFISMLDILKKYRVYSLCRTECMM